MGEPVDVTLGSGPPETVLVPPPQEWLDALAAAQQVGETFRPAALAVVAAEHPRLLEAWADLAEVAAASGDHVAAYAYARVGYHRGLDALRGAGWRGTGYVRWHHEPNRGFLRSLEALRREAGAIGERYEEERCRVFLRQLDPEWREQPAG